ncbi:MAG TPA: hypothetical protein VFX61_23115, partial [Micromonosporaceae bacterium]|nr:hypothetical protein [Micromonosporaceae bacterium]
MRKARRVVVAGVVGGLAFALFSMISVSLIGEGFWRPLNLVADTFWRGAPTGGTFNLGAAVLGLVALSVAGVLLFTPFAVLAIGAGMSAPIAIAGASIYANVVWVIGHFLIWEKLDPVAATEFSPGVAWVA